jgi:hypothetical protein
VSLSSNSAKKSFGALAEVANKSAWKMIATPLQLRKTKSEFDLLLLVALPTRLNF